MWLQELALLDESSTVYKLIGPAMIKQDLMEASTNVAKRLEYIQGEVKRITSKLTELEAKSKEQQQLVSLSRTTQCMHGDAVSRGLCRGPGMAIELVLPVARVVPGSGILSAKTKLHVCQANPHTCICTRFGGLRERGGCGAGMGHNRNWVWLLPSCCCPCRSSS